MSEVTRVLTQMQKGDPSAAEQLLPLVYDELRKLAAQKLAHETPGQTLQATALVHEAYLRLMNVEQGQHWDSRRHFFAAVAESMRILLTARDRAASAVAWQRIRLDQIDLCVGEPPKTSSPRRRAAKLAVEDPSAPTWSSCGSSRGDAGGGRRHAGIARRTADRHGRSLALAL
jgi:hypothetical protein